MADRETMATRIALVQKDIGYMKDNFDNLYNKMDSLEKKIGSGYVSKEEFEPIKKIVYGLVGLILVAVVGAVVSLVLKGGS